MTTGDASPECEAVAVHRHACGNAVPVPSGRAAVVHARNREPAESAEYTEPAGISTPADATPRSPEPPADWRGRWRALNPVIVHDIPRSPQEQMSLDERWAREVASGARPATLRFWEWSAPAIVVGRFQSIPDEVRLDQARREGFHVVRRCTGGGAMVVTPRGAITYSLYAPRAFIADCDARQAYRLCDGWLVDTLRSLGVNAGFSGLNDIASPQGKIGGAAQRRFPARAGGPGAVLHHTTLAYDLDGGLMARVLNTSGEKLSDKAVRSASRRVDPLRRRTAMSRDALLARLLASVQGIQ